MRKILVVFALALCMLIAFSVVSFASTDIIPQYYVHDDGYEYIPGSSSITTNYAFVHDAANYGYTADSVTYSAQITHSASSNTSVSASLSGMVAQVGFGFEVSLGVSYTQTASFTFSIDPRSIMRCEAGTKWGSASGTENYWEGGQLKSSRGVSGTWTHTFTNKYMIQKL